MDDDKQQGCHELSLLTYLYLAGAEHREASIAQRFLLGTRFRHQPLAPTARPCGLRGLTARRGQAKEGHHAMNADIRLALFNRTYDALGKGQLSDGKSRKKTLDLRSLI
jgi:hypothetical protein